MRLLSDVAPREARPIFNLCTLPKSGVTRCRFAAASSRSIAWRSGARGSASCLRRFDRYVCRGRSVRRHIRRDGRHRHRLGRSHRRRARLPHVGVVHDHRRAVGSRPQESAQRRNRIISTALAPVRTQKLRSPFCIPGAGKKCLAPGADLQSRTACPIKAVRPGRAAASRLRPGCARKSPSCRH